MLVRAAHILPAGVLLSALIAATPSSNTSAAQNTRPNSQNPNSQNPNSPGAKLCRAEVDRVLTSRQSSVIPTDLDPARESFDNAWQIEASGYEVRTTRSPYYAKWCASHAAAAERELREFLGLGDVEVNGTPAIWIHPSLTELNALGESYDERSSISGAFFAAETPGQPVATYEPENSRGNPDWGLQVYFLRYGVTLQFLSRAFPNVDLPHALSQGLAAYIAMKPNRAFWLGQFEQIKASQDSRWLTVSNLMAAPLAAYTAAEAPRRPEDRLVMLATLFRYLDEHEFKGQSVMESLFASAKETGELPADHPVMNVLLRDADRLDGVLRKFSGWTD